MAATPSLFRLSAYHHSVEILRNWLEGMRLRSNYHGDMTKARQKAFQERRKQRQEGKTPPTDDEKKEQAEAMERKCSDAAKEEKDAHLAVRQAKDAITLSIKNLTEEFKSTHFVRFVNDLRATLQADPNAKLVRYIQVTHMDCTSTAVDFLKVYTDIVEPLAKLQCWDSTVDGCITHEYAHTVLSACIDQIYPEATAKPPAGSETYPQLSFVEAGCESGRAKFEWEFASDVPSYDGDSAQGNDEEEDAEEDGDEDARNSKRSKVDEESKAAPIAIERWAPGSLTQIAQHVRVEFTGHATEMDIPTGATGNVVYLPKYSV